MKCTGKMCPMQVGFDVETCELGPECKCFTPKPEQKTTDYYEGFYDAANLIMETLKAAISGK